MKSYCWQQCFKSKDYQTQIDVRVRQIKPILAIIFMIESHPEISEVVEDDIDMSPKKYFLKIFDEYPRYRQFLKFSKNGHSSRFR
jgi:hypothetical protein